MREKGRTGPHRFDNRRGWIDVELDQFKYTLSTYEAPLKEVRDSLNLDAKIRRLIELDKTMEEPSFWRMRSGLPGL